MGGLDEALGPARIVKMVKCVRALRNLLRVKVGGGGGGGLSPSLQSISPRHHMPMSRLSYFTQRTGTGGPPPPYCTSGLAGSSAWGGRPPPVTNVVSKTDPDVSFSCLPPAQNLMRACIRMWEGSIEPPPHGSALCDSSWRLTAFFFFSPTNACIYGQVEDSNDLRMAGRAMEEARRFFHALHDAAAGEEPPTDEWTLWSRLKRGGV